MDGGWTNLVALFVVFALGFLMGRRSHDGGNIEPLDENRLSSAALSRIDAAIARGQKIEAIRIAREDCGAGLAEAKMFVDAREAAHRKGDPIER